jgi:hypothetical protein
VAFNVSKDGTVTTYAGPTQSQPSHTVAVTAKVTDDMTRPLAGLTINFQVGTQSCSAVTDASGTASCAIPKLNQKAGSYTMTASFAGTGDYLASSASAAFKIGKYLADVPTYVVNG